MIHKLKEQFNVWHETPDEAKPLVSMLEGYGIPYQQGYEERVPHDDERWFSTIDYKVWWTVSFLVPDTLRTDRKFIQRLHEYCPLSEECDFE